MKLCEDVLRNVSSTSVDRDTSHWQFWARSEPVNIPKTIKCPAKCEVRAVIRFLYSENATRNVLLRYCPSTWQCSAAHCRCNKEEPEAFSMGSVWSPTITSPDLTPCDFHLFPLMRRTIFWYNELQTSVENRLKAQAAGFYDKGNGKLVPHYEKCLCWSIDYVEK